MRDHLRERLLLGYRTGQGAAASAGIYRDIRAVWPYYEQNYARVVDRLDPATTAVLDVGTGHGSLLAWLRHRGFVHLAGVDASPGDVDFANAQLGASIVTLGEAQAFLRAREQSYDAIFVKAMLEHVAKAELLPLLDAVADALRPGGVFVADVPNMDWLFAMHERYMDLTHEVGFTRESLAVFLGLRFRDVTVAPSRIGAPTRSQRLLRPLALRVLRRLLYVLGEGADSFLFASRSLIAVAREAAPAGAPDPAEAADTFGEQHGP